MTTTWLRAKKTEFVRDIIRDFCLVAKLLEEEFVSFQENSELSFERLKYLIGTETNKGLLWRLKDTAHHLFRSTYPLSVVGQLLDWCIGYIFHESIKLREDAYQKDNYGPWFNNLRQTILPATISEICTELYQVLFQTRESMEREIKRIRFIIFQCRNLLVEYLSEHSDNPLVARFMFDQPDLVKEVFGHYYEHLIEGVYGNEPEKMYVLASRSLRQGGWTQDAALAMEEAIRLNGDSDLVRNEDKALKKAMRELLAQTP